MNAEVTVPWGTFAAMVVKVSDELRQETAYEYYVDGLGLVKIERESPTQNIVQELTEVRDEPLQEYVQMFYDWTAEVQLDDEGGEHYFMQPQYDTVLAHYPTNGDISRVYTDLIRSYFKDKFNLELSDGARINGMHFTPGSGVLRIDLSDAFLNDLSVNGETEPYYLQVMADSFGYIYNAFYATFSVDGGAYSSQNITIDHENDDLIELSMYKDASKFAAENE